MTARNGTKLKEAAALSTVAGLLSGTVVAGVFSPWDRALYLSVTKKRAFLIADNFTSPYHGFNQAVIQRIISNSCYFVLQRQVMELGDVLQIGQGKKDGLFYSLYIGSVAGALNGMILNQLASIKYHMWNHPGWTFTKAASHMYSEGGLRVFFKGIRATGLRDFTFGCVYEPLRRVPKRLDPDQLYLHPFVGNSIAAGLATIASGPFNYIRVVQYAHPPNLPPPTHISVLRDLVQRAATQPTLLEKLGYLQSQLRIGWGTARVAVGMAVGQQVFDRAYDLLKS